MDGKNFGFKPIPILIALLSFFNVTFANPFTQDTSNTDYSTISLFLDGHPYSDVGEGLATYPLVAANKKGEYLAKAGDCIGCHTKKDGKPFAGGLGFDTPFGRIYSPNITPDKSTGIGKWSHAEFIKAMQQGIAPHHKYLYPAFPYIYFNKITRQDLLDIKAYLDAIPPVHQKNNKNKIPFPFNIRFLQIGWRLLFFDFQKTNDYQFDIQHDVLWNRGAYLVKSLGHCDMCHTPMYHFVKKEWILGAPILSKHLSGAYVSGFYAPDISHLFIQQISLTQLQNVFWKAERIEGGSVQGPMFQAIHDSLQFLTPDDIKAIYTYLGSVKSANLPKPKLTGDTNQDGKKIYVRYCKTCHETGKGVIPLAPALDDTEKWKLLKKLGAEQLYQYAWRGLDGMPIRGTCTDCTYEDIQNTVEYMLKESIPPKDSR